MTAAASRKVTTFQLIFMTYSVLCSGAYGLEEMISASGPGLALLTLLVLPIIWGLPIGLLCAELSACYPVEGGYYRWTRLAFGDFTGYLAGWLVWLASYATNATFAVLFANYVRYFWPELPHLAHWAIASSVVWLTVYLNWRGIRPVGTASVILTCLIFLPFLAMTLLGIWHWQHNPLQPFVAPGRTPLSAFLSSLGIGIWLYSGLEKLTPSAGEVENPARAFPIAMACGIVLSALSYIIPTAFGLAAHGHYADWGESYFSVVAQALGGPWLGTAMTAGGLISSVCLLMVTMLGQSRLPMVMAEDGLFPRIFARTHPRYGSPTVSLLFGGVVLSALCFGKFSYLVSLFSLVQVLAYGLIFATLIKLRKKEGSTPPTKGFRIPLSPVGIWLLFVPCVLLSGLVIVKTMWPKDVFDGRQALIDAGVLLSGPVTYALFRRSRREEARL